jgi:hypothetical protein
MPFFSMTTTLPAGIARLTNRRLQEESEADVVAPELVARVDGAVHVAVVRQIDRLEPIPIIVTRTV